ncbi:hypothetical protein [Herbiconiux sp. 11R-BC]|uniref:hypothetical protein n=1 Tax=Herbiconiux sp. 11R-BC TaxID=3111637 RepID=UPI003C30B925
MAGRRAKLHQFHEAVNVIRTVVDDDDELIDVVVTLCVHAGIAASDVICLRSLGHYWRSGNHAEAVTHLRRVDPESARLLHELLNLKSRAAYGHDAVTKAQLTKATRAMDRLVEAASLA